MFHHCWEICKHSEKFKDPPRREHGVSQPSPVQLSPLESPIDLNQDEDKQMKEEIVGPFPRLQGRKKSKEAQRKGKKHDPQNNRLCVAMETIAMQNLKAAELMEKRDADYAKMMEFQQQLTLRKGGEKEG